MRLYTNNEECIEMTYSGEHIETDKHEYENVPTIAPESSRFYKITSRLEKIGSGIKSKIIDYKNSIDTAIGVGLVSLTIKEGYYPSGNIPFSLVVATGFLYIYYQYKSSSIDINTNPKPNASI